MLQHAGLQHAACSHFRRPRGVDFPSSFQLPYTMRANTPWQPDRTFHLSMASQWGRLRLVVRCTKHCARRMRNATRCHASSVHQCGTRAHRSRLLVPPACQLHTRLMQREHCERQLSC